MILSKGIYQYFMLKKMFDNLGNASKIGKFLENPNNEKEWKLNI